jgi:hypothetical protein
MLFPCEGFLLLRPGMTLSPVILSLVTLSFVLLPVMAVLGLDPGISPGHPASRPLALILRSSREAASRRRVRKNPELLLRDAACSGSSG